MATLGRLKPPEETDILLSYIRNVRMFSIQNTICNTRPKQTLETGGQIKDQVLSKTNCFPSHVSSLERNLK